MENRCTLEQAQQITKTATLDLLLYVAETYSQSYRDRLSQYGEGEQAWSMASALQDIFTMGYVSGVRAEREKKRA